MPWQRYVADVVMEIDPATGLLAYQEMGLTVPRQSGKSTWVEAKAAHRCTATKFFGPRQHVVYTAQTRQKAREKWEEDFAADLEAARDFKSRISVHKGNGAEHIRFANRSRFGLEAATEKAGHGPTLDEAYIDEAFAHQDWRLEQAFGPAMITRLNKLLAWISTAGWEGGSPYLAEKVELGRLVASEGRQRGIAYFEWSAPEDADPGDPAVWWACMPALGWTITEEAIRVEYEKARDSGKLNEFRRAYLNQWVPKDAPDTWSAVPEATWAALADPHSEPGRPFALSCVFASRREAAAVGLAGQRADGLLHVEVAEYRPGTSWVAQRMVELAARYEPCAVVVDPSGHEGSVIHDLEDAGIEVTKPGARDVAAAYGLFFDAVTDSGILRHRNEDELNLALAGATTRNVGDGGQAWGRRKSGVDISPLVAVTSALWGFTRFGTLGDYDARRSVHFDVAELIRLVKAGVYGPIDVERIWARDLLDDAALTRLAAEGIPLPAAVRGD